MLILSSINVNIYIYIYIYIYSIYIYIFYDENSFKETNLGYAEVSCSEATIKISEK